MTCQVTWLNIGDRNWALNWQRVVGLQLNNTNDEILPTLYIINVQCYLVFYLFFYYFVFLLFCFQYIPVNYKDKTKLFDIHWLLLSNILMVDRFQNPKQTGKRTHGHHESTTCWPHVRQRALWDFANKNIYWGINRSPTTPKRRKLQWSHNRSDGVSNYLFLYCLFNCMFKCRSKTQ